MKMSRAHCVTFLLLVVSVAVNVWQSLREAPDSVRPRITAHPAGNPPSVPQAPPASSLPVVADIEDEGEFESVENLMEFMDPAEQMTERELLFYKKMSLATIQTEDRVSPERLKVLAASPVRDVTKLKVRARLLLPGERALDFGEQELEAGTKVEFSHTEAFPFPGTFNFPKVPMEGTAMPVTPVTPSALLSEETGVWAEVGFECAPGGFLLKGSFSQKFMESMSRMPGETFAPVMDGETVLTDNRALQPRFTTRDAPFIAFAGGGSPVRVPVSTSFGETFLELTCMDVE